MLQVTRQGQGTTFLCPLLAKGRKTKSGPSEIPNLLGKTRLLHLKPLGTTDGFQMLSPEAENGKMENTCLLAGSSPLKI